VTVVVPSFNEDPRFVRASLESIRAQTFTDFECIVVDESTCPELADFCRGVCNDDPRFIYMRPAERLGLAGSLNLAINNARGQLIARFDSDDICMPERIELQVAFLQAHPDISVVGGAINIISTEGTVTAHRVYPQSSNEIEKAIQFTNAMAHPTVMFRKQAFVLCGGYNPDYRYCEDLDMWLRWLNAGFLFANLPQVMVNYRQDNTKRSQGNWRYNLHARLSNFRIRHFSRRIVGIFCIVAWMATPENLREKIYKAVILGRRDQVVTK
jgi:glycosyltransferase involved in cell wall biosynthesis